MTYKSRMAIFVLSALALIAGDGAWKNKQFPEWTEDDAKDLLKDSPWVKTVAATLVKPSPKDVQVSSNIGRRRHREIERHDCSCERQAADADAALGERAAGTGGGVEGSRRYGSDVG